MGILGCQRYGSEKYLNRKLQFVRLDDFRKEPYVARKMYEFIDIPPIYKYIDVGNFVDGLAYVKDVTEKFGYIDKTGEEVIPCIYDKAENFSGGLAVVTLNDKKGCINTSGDIVIPYGEIIEKKNYKSNDEAYIRRLGNDFEYEDYELCQMVLLSAANIE